MCRKRQKVFSCWELDAVKKTKTYMASELGKFFFW